ncbi:MAG: hypothetical protein DRJ05_07505 [Bacteroidetes bacterium]|nr:MAG: hypothetical protein DRJ05_07505 [Bacteroidota bacterium]
MKRKQIIISIFISILIFSSCREIKVNTVVNKDGSFTRMIVITGDSSEVIKTGLPYPVDETWKRELLRDTTDHENHVLTYTKYFENSDLLNQEISQDTGWKKNLNRNILVEEKFGFFYSYPIYTETIKAANPFTILDYKEYLGKEDMLWITGKKLALNSSDSAKIEDAEKKADAFIEEAFTSELIAGLKKAIEQLNNPAVNPELVEIYRDSIVSKIDDYDYDSTLEFVDFLAEWSNNDEILKLKEIKPDTFEKLDNTIKLIINVLSMEPYKVFVEMPGIITETNSLSTKGNQVQWNVAATSILFEDYNMIVESRIINKWMFVIAGIVLLSLIIMIIFKSRK